MARWRFGRREDRGRGINEGGRKGKAEQEEWGFLDLFFGRFLFCIYLWEAFLLYFGVI